MQHEVRSFSSNGLKKSQLHPLLTSVHFTKKISLIYNYEGHLLATNLLGNTTNLNRMRVSSSTVISDFSSDSSP
jgi:hypothetical protein